jgi:pimeloyl-ACP methyl ester carboxylesterase
MPCAAVNGLKMNYEIYSDGPPLLPLHGSTSSIEDFTLAIPFFAAKFRLIAIKQMGHRRAGDLMDRPFHYHDLAKGTVEIMHLKEIKSAIVIGYSDGGTIGFGMAIHYPERVTKLAITGANFRTDDHTAQNQ